MSLQNTVQSWLDEQGNNYDNGNQGAYDDLMEHGCQSGMVSDLIYNSDTVAFYQKHQSEIDHLLSELIDGTGETIDALFERAGWDKSDPLARDTTNQNILAWFGFEEMARIIMA